MQTRLGVLGGAGTVTVETGTKYCFKDATNIICASEVLIAKWACFRTGVVSLDEKFSVSVIIKGNTLTRNFVQADGLKERMGAACCPLCWLHSRNWPGKRLGS